MQTPPLAEWSHFRYCTSLLGADIAAQDHTQGAAWAALRGASATQMAHLSQPKLEAILRAEAERRVGDAGGQLLFGYECVALNHDSGGVQAELRRVGSVGSAADDGLPDAGKDCMLVEADQMLACDGSHSPMRDLLGLRLRGPPPLQHFKSVHFTAPELAPLLRKSGREAMLYFVFNRGAIAVLVAHNINQGQWVAQLPFFPGLQDGSELDREACTKAIADCIGGASAAAAGGESVRVGGSLRATGDAAVRFEVHSIGSWAMSARVAERLTLGHVHLLGDAAHQFPPAGAFGANTGFQDAHNLCWKLAAVHHGHAGSALLRSYDTERRPVALANARLSVHNYVRGLRVTNALGLPSELPHTVASVLHDAPPTLPSQSAAQPHPTPGPTASSVASSAADESVGLDLGFASLVTDLSRVGLGALHVGTSVLGAGRIARAANTAMANAATTATTTATATIVATTTTTSAAAATAAAAAQATPLARPGSQLLEFGRAQLIDTFGHNAQHALGGYRRRWAMEVVNSGAALPMLFARHELGFVYPTPLSKAGSAEEDDASIEDETYVPSTAPGCRVCIHTGSVGTACPMRPRLPSQPAPASLAPCATAWSSSSRMDLVCHPSPCA